MTTEPAARIEYRCEHMTVKPKNGLPHPSLRQITCFRGCQMVPVFVAAVSPDGSYSIDLPACDSPALGLWTQAVGELNRACTNAWNRLRRGAS